LAAANVELTASLEQCQSIVDVSKKDYAALNKTLHDNIHFIDGARQCAEDKAACMRNYNKFVEQNICAEKVKVFGCFMIIAYTVFVAAVTKIIF
jgi:hypothetical protein